MNIPWGGCRLCSFRYEDEFNAVSDHIDPKGQAGRVKKPAILKHRARKGILPQFRGLSWFILSVGKRSWLNLVLKARTTQPSFKNPQAMMRDLDRTFPTHLYS
ncbi:hypothetical protein CEUSTIGMA_g11729.t1 [Chlamydomonas eustigma]|uniref:Uncharacterized protein n=1 Tax=Chlamydomonas eustigma TaxID=1157962 RepID=A0A250XMK7_9CHLO|nr:hypothetical protein CEUSTIGMA_g11729.t1 [Chlamydomonas eustigma]|eukprot:GAX84307.1 hypothetical protein CEUSTIGMA_g11729.t1 [Chlamydomonas eustigma]